MDVKRKEWDFSGNIKVNGVKQNSTKMKNVQAKGT